MGDLIDRNDTLKIIADTLFLYGTNSKAEREIISIISRMPPAGYYDLIEKNKDLILQAGMEGREVEFRIGGRLFAIREKAQ